MRRSQSMLKLMIHSPTNLVCLHTFFLLFSFSFFCTSNFLWARERCELGAREWPQRGFILTFCQPHPLAFKRIYPLRVNFSLSLESRRNQGKREGSRTDYTNLCITNTFRSRPKELSLGTLRTPPTTPCYADSSDLAPIFTLAVLSWNGVKSLRGETTCYLEDIQPPGANSYARGNTMQIYS